MYLTDTGYWRPDIDEVVILDQFPHFIKVWAKNEEGKTFRGITIPGRYHFGLEVGEEYVVKSVISAQDFHYEYISIEPKIPELCEFEGGKVIALELPQSYFKRHPDKEYPNRFKK